MWALEKVVRLRLDEALLRGDKLKSARLIRASSISTRLHPLRLFTPLPPSFCTFSSAPTPIYLFMWPIPKRTVAASALRISSVTKSQVTPPNPMKAEMMLNSNLPLLKGGAGHPDLLILRSARRDLCEKQRWLQRPVGHFKQTDQWLNKSITTILATCHCGQCLLV